MGAHDAGLGEARNCGARGGVTREGWEEGPRTHRSRTGPRSPWGCHLRRAPEGVGMRRRNGRPPALPAPAPPEVRGARESCWRDVLGAGPDHASAGGGSICPRGLPSVSRGPPRLAVGWGWHVSEATEASSISLRATSLHLTNQPRGTGFFHNILQKNLHKLFGQSNF